MLAEPDAPAAGRTRSPRIDQLDAGVLKRGDQLHQRIDVGPDHAVAGFHALNGGNGKVSQVGCLPLIDIQEGAGGPELVGRDHEIAASGSIRIEYIYPILITVSSISLDAKYINDKVFRRLKRFDALGPRIESFSKNAQNIISKTRKRWRSTNFT